MLSAANLAPLGSVGLQLLRALGPHVGCALRTRVFSRALVTATVSAAAQPQPTTESSAESFGDSLPSHDGLDLGAGADAHHGAQRFFHVLSSVR
jgi:hypothetical protein